MNRFLAKSNPQETIQQHTDHLIENFDILKALYPNLEINWDILYLACLYHDLGKMNGKFQEKITTGKKHENEISHGILSLSFIEPRKLMSEGFSSEEIKILANAVAYHHERELSYENDTLDEEIQLLKEEAKSFIYDKLKDIEVKKLGARFFVKNKRIHQLDDEDIFFNYVQIKGLLNRLDYAASAGIEVEKENNFLLNNMEFLLDEWKSKKSGAAWNVLQRHLIRYRDDNVIVIAETGMGKTEAGLLWIGDNKGFFTLPLKTAINAMYERIIKQIVKEEYEDRVGLLHSDTYSEYLNRNLDDEINIDEYFNKTKQLSLPLTICTLDQIFDFVYRYRGFEPKLATLAYSKIVIDEVQMYSSDLLAYLILGIYYITKVGGKFAILTATLPNIVVDLLREEGIEFVAPKTFTNKNRIRHSVKKIPKTIDTKEIIKLYHKNKILVICNTVKEAQRIYRELKEDHKIVEINLFHSNYIKRDRKEKEKKILSIGNRDSKEYGIWVTTQVVEASLDIDFDILCTELSDLNGLFQRLGRCYRGRSFEQEGHNCYVFDGGEHECSGIGTVIDRDIFNLSKMALQSINGPLTEEDKMELVSNIYTTENLKNTEYYKGVKSNLEYVKSIEDHELNKNEVKKRFRNINSKTVIPKVVYDQHKEEIQEYIRILSETFNPVDSAEERKIMKIRKTIARSKLMEFTLSVPHHRVGGNIVGELMLNKYESIPLLNCKYSKEMGVEYIRKDDFIKKQQLGNFF